MTPTSQVHPSWNLKRLEFEIERCLHGSERESYQHGDDILWLMGWADLSIEAAIMRERAAEAIQPDE